MRVLVLSFYFRPDLSAGSFRTTAFVNTMSELLPPGSQIDVITTLPNRYHSFTADAPRIERQLNLSVFRIPLRKHQSGMVDQAKAFLFFSYQAARQANLGEYDVVFATSSRLMTAVLGAWIARSRKARLYLDIRDILVDNVKHITPRAVSWIVKPILSSLERWAVRRAEKVNLVSAGFTEYFARRYPQQQFSFFTNGIDDEFLTPQAPTKIDANDTDRPIIALYAGNVGEGQGLHAIVPRLAKRLGSRVQFKIIGDGGRKKMLEAELLAQGVTNVELLLPIERSGLIKAYCEADVLFLHLNDYESFEKVLPSKLFEYAASRRPLWVGASGYTAEFVRSEIGNAAVFRPCDVDGAVQALSELAIQDTPREAFLAKYAREHISRQMAEDVMALAGQGS